MPQIKQLSTSECLDEIARTSIRIVDEIWKENPRPMRDGTKMLMIPEGLFERLENVVKQLKENGEYL